MHRSSFTSWFALGALLLGGAAAPAQAARWSEALASKLDPALIAWVKDGVEPRTLWVTFAARGDGDPAALAAQLGEASAALTPKARARRLRAGVWPLVDERDLPVDAAHLEA